MMTFISIFVILSLTLHCKSINYVSNLNIRKGGTTVIHLEIDDTHHYFGSIAEYV